MLAQPDPQKNLLSRNPFLYSRAVSRHRRYSLSSGSWPHAGWKTATSRSTPGKSATRKQQEQDRITLEQMGGKELAIQKLLCFSRNDPPRRNRSSFATASPTPRPSSSNLSPIPCGPPIPAVSM